MRRYEISDYDWRDLPECFGSWNSVCQRFRRWARRGVWQRIFNPLPDAGPGLAAACLDHRQGPPTRGGTKK